VVHQPQLLTGFTANLLGRRIGALEIWELAFEGLEVGQQAVVFGIRDGGIVQDVIAVIVVAYRFPELSDCPFCLFPIVDCLVRCF
jgi:hypothetical protein